MNTEVSPMHPESFVATLLEKKFSEGSMWLDTILNDDMVMWGWRRTLDNKLRILSFLSRHTRLSSMQAEFLCSGIFFNFDIL
jgi:hypothetical protein